MPAAAVFCWLLVVDVEAGASSIGEGVVKVPVLCTTGRLAEMNKVGQPQDANRCVL